MKKNAQLLCIVLLGLLLALSIMGLVAAQSVQSAPNPPRGMQLTGIAYQDPNGRIPTLYRLSGDGLACLVNDKGGVRCK